jgi:hypothetical protein
MVVKLSEATFRPLFFKVRFSPSAPPARVWVKDEETLRLCCGFSCLIGPKQKMPQRTDCWHFTTWLTALLRN